MYLIKKKITIFKVKLHYILIIDSWLYVGTLIFLIRGDNSNISKNQKWYLNAKHVHRVLPVTMIWPGPLTLIFGIAPGRPPFIPVGKGTGFFRGWPRTLTFRLLVKVNSSPSTSSSTKVNLKFTIEYEKNFKKEILF